jgi:hypothetical protein
MLCFVVVLMMCKGRLSARGASWCVYGRKGWGEASIPASVPECWCWYCSVFASFLLLPVAEAELLL